MNEEYLEMGILDIKDSIRNDIRNGDFDKFLIFTYKIDPDLFEWFPPKSRIAIYTNTREVTKIRDYKGNFLKIITAKVLDTHAKIYLMWSDRKIKCWLGSFNFTSEGLYRNIEWAAPFQGKLLCSLGLEDVLSGDLCSISTDNMVINQVLSLVNSEIRRREPIFCDKIFQNANLDLVLLHNRGTDTLSKALSRIVAHSDGRVKVVYFTPYMNKSGILDFCNCFSGMLNFGDVEFQIFTNKPDLSYDSGTFLRSNDIQDLKSKFKSFTLLKRKTKDGGTLIYGKNSKEHPTEISGDFIHLKLIHFAFINKEGVPEHHSIFTSANLTEKVWGGTGENFEIGLWVRGQNENTIINSFVEKFSICFSEPDKSDLDEIDHTMEAVQHRNKTEEYWIENLLEKRIQLNSDSITIRWEDYLPKISDVECILHLRDIVTGATYNEVVSLNEKNHSFSGKVTSFNSSKNVAVDYMEVILTTNFNPPEVVIKEKYVKEYLSSQDGKIFLQFKGDIESNWTEVVVNNKLYPTSNKTEIELPTAQITSISLRKLQDSMEKVGIFIKMENQPILNGSFFIDTTSLLEKVNGLGELLRIDLRVNDVVDPPFDTVTFKDVNSNTVEYIGFSKAGSVLTYYFRRNLKAQPYIAAVGAPYDAYFKGTSIRLKTLAWTNKSEAEICSVLAENPLFHEIVGLDLEDRTIMDKFISDRTRISIRVPCELLKKFSFDQIKYYCKEDFLSYRPSKLCNLPDELSLFEPYSKVLYWATIQVTTGSREISFFTSKNSFIVKRSVVADLPVRDKKTIPKSLPFSRIESDHPIAWIVINLNDVELNEADENLRQRIRVEAWKNKNKLREKVLSVLKSGRIYCIPIFKREINTRIELSLVIRFEDDPFLFDYSWFIRKECYDITAKKSDRVEIRQYKASGLASQIQIKNEKNSDMSELFIEGPFASGHKVDKVAREDKIVKHLYHNKIFLLPKENLLICLEQA